MTWNRGGVRSFKTSHESSLEPCYLSVGRGFDVGVALLAGDVVDVPQSAGGDAGERLGAVGGEVAVRAPRAPEIRRALNDHGGGPERLSGKRGGMEPVSRGSPFMDFKRLIS